MIVNLTQHPASPEQVAAGVVDLPTDQRRLLVESLTVDTLPTRQAIADLIRQEEREQCAVLCESFQYHPVHQTPENCAETIRERTTT